MKLGDKALTIFIKFWWELLWFRQKWFVTISIKNGLAYGRSLRPMYSYAIKTVNENNLSSYLFLTNSTFGFQHACLRLRSKSWQAMGVASDWPHGADPEEVHRFPDDEKVANVAVHRRGRWKGKHFWSKVLTWNEIRIF